MIATAPPRRYDKHLIPAGIALAAPAVRMVVVQAWAHRDPDGRWDDGHEIYPVLAIVGTQAHGYSRPKGSGRPERRSGSPRTMERLGWSYDEWEARPTFAVVVRHPEDGELSLAEYLECSNTAQEVVVCDWPRRQDGPKLAPAVARVKAEARRKAEAQGRPAAAS